jgi:hypothetical protein
MNNWNNNYNNYNNCTTWNYRKLNKNVVRYSAGVLPYTFDQNGKCFFLLGKDNENDWSDFGGRCEYRDHSEPLNTASREFYEETLGAVNTIPEIFEKISQPSAIKIVSKTLNQSPYYMYLVYIENLNYSESFIKTSNFLKYHYSQDKRNISKVIEKVSIRWVSMDTLLNCVENKIENKEQLISLRGVFFKTISNCKEQLMFLSSPSPK